MKDSNKKWTRCLYTVTESTTSTKNPNTNWVKLWYSTAGAFFLFVFWLFIFLLFMPEHRKEINESRISGKKTRKKMKEYVDSRSYAILN